MTKPKHKGIVILGCPRSGTTLLRRILGAHPNVAAPGETNLLTACARFLEGEPSVDGMEVGVINGLGFLGFEETDIVAPLRNMAFDIREKHAAGQGKSRWVEKTAVDAFHVDAIEKLCGDDLYFICLTRHGLDAACSMNDWCEKAQTYPSELHDYIRRFPRPLEAFCHAWVDATTAVRSFAERHPDNAISIRYEDLIDNPANVLKDVFEFIEETWSEDLVETALSEPDAQGFSDWKTFATSQVVNTSANRWRSLSKATAAGLAPIVNPLLEACGYEAVRIDIKDSDVKARRRYEMGLALQKSKTK